MSLSNAQSRLSQGPGTEKCIWEENTILSTKLKILFHVLFVGVGLCATQIKGLAWIGQHGDMKKGPIYKRICFLCLSMNHFTWYTISIVGLKSISAKCLGLHWWLDELNWEQSVTWEFAHSGYLMPLCCLRSDHSFRMLCSGHLARKRYVFWYHSFLIRTRISFQTPYNLPLATRHCFCYIFGWSSSNVLIIQLLIIQVRTASLR